MKNEIWPRSEINIDYVLVYSLIPSSAPASSSSSFVEWDCVDYFISDDVLWYTSTAFETVIILIILIRCNAMATNVFYWTISVNIHKNFCVVIARELLLFLFFHSLRIARAMHTTYVEYYVFQSSNLYIHHCRQCTAYCLSHSRMVCLLLHRRQPVGFVKKRKKTRSTSTHGLHRLEICIFVPISIAKRTTP